MQTGQPEAQLRGLLHSAVAGSETGAMILARPNGSAKLAVAIKHAVARHSDEWRRNQELGWSTLSASELQSACDAINRRDRSEFIRIATKVGTTVKQRNEPLLEKAGAEVLAEAS